MIQVSIAKHAVAFPSKTLASNGGKHIYSIELAETTLGYADNGWFVGKGDFVELDHHKEAAPGNFSGKVVAKAANGNYYVEVVSCDEGTLFVYQVPMIEEQYSNKYELESNYTNEGTQVVRAYQLAPGDVIELSAEGFTAEPSAYDGTVTVTLQTITDAVFAKQLGE